MMLLNICHDTSSSMQLFQQEGFDSVAANSCVKRDRWVIFWHSIIRKEEFHC